MRGLPALVAAITAAAAPIAYTYMFFGFRPYDDEGYELLTLGDYLSGKPVVSPFVQLYGPFYYEVWGAVYKVLGVLPDHDNGRLLTLLAWLVAGGLGGVAAYRLTRSLLLAGAGQVVTLSVLTVLSSEPMTTYGLIAVLLLGAVVAATFRAERPRASAFALGGAVAALALIKLNVGCFAAAAVAVAWVATLPARPRRLLWPPALGLLALLPFAVTAARLTVDWALQFAVVVSLSAAAAGFSAATARPGFMPPPALRWLIAGALAITVLTVSIATASGASLRDLWDDVVVASLRFPGLFVVPMPGDLGTDLWAAFCALGGIVFSRLSRFLGARTGIVRVWAGGLLWLLALRQPSALFLLGLPLAWIAARPAGEDAGEPPGRPYCRVFVPLLAVIGALQAYPVAGSQMALSALGLVPAGAIMLDDGVRELRRAGAGQWLLLALARWTSPVALAVSLAAFMALGLVAAEGFASGVALDLPGARALRVPSAQAAQLRAVVAGIERDCSSFVTYPGMDSFYLWTSQKPPSEVRWGLWPLNLDDAQQASAVRELTARPRLCVVENQRLMDFWSGDRPVARRPLVNYIDQAFVDAAAYGDYQLLVRG